MPVHRTLYEATKPRTASPYKRATETTGLSRPLHEILTEQYNNRRVAKELPTTHRVDPALREELKQSRRTAAMLRMKLQEVMARCNLKTRLLHRFASVEEDLTTVRKEYALLVEKLSTCQDEIKALLQRKATVDVDRRRVLEENKKLRKQLEVQSTDYMLLQESSLAAEAETRQQADEIARLKALLDERNTATLNDQHRASLDPVLIYSQFAQTAQERDTLREQLIVGQNEFTHLQTQLANTRELADSVVHQLQIASQSRLRAVLEDVASTTGTPIEDVCLRYRYALDLPLVLEAAVISSSVTHAGASASARPPEGKVLGADWEGFFNRRSVEDVSGSTGQPLSASDAPCPSSSTPLDNPYLHNLVT